MAQTANDHFKQAREAVKSFEDINQKIKNAVKDLISDGAKSDVSSSNHKDLSELRSKIPEKRLNLSHAMHRWIELDEKNNDRYFEIVESIPDSKRFITLIEEFLQLKIEINGLSHFISSQDQALLMFSRQLKKANYGTHEKEEAQNTRVEVEALNGLSTKLQTSRDTLIELDKNMLELASISKMIEARVKTEIDMKQKFSQNTRKPYKAQNLIDVSEIDSIFDDLESQSLGGIYLNFVSLGMLVVIGASVMIWIKLNSFESKHRM